MFGLLVTLSTSVQLFTFWSEKSEKKEEQVLNIQLDKI